MTVPMTPIDAALERLLSALPVCTDTVTVPVEDSVGRVAHADVRSLTAVPPWANSAVDGYALCTADLQQVPASFPVSQRIAAGGQGASLQPGTVARIFTGAPLPANADAVVMQENCRDDGATVEIARAAMAGENVRQAGEDIARDALLLRRGQRIRVQDIALLAAAGQGQLKVCRPLKVAVLTTGDELQIPGQPLQPGQIYNSNYYSLAALLKRLGMETVNLGQVADTLDATRQALSQAVAQADCVVSSGGVSVGDADHVKAAASALGSLTLWKLAIKPGKPFAFAMLQGKPFFGLPGNPVSAFVTFALLVRPALLCMSGASALTAQTRLLPAGFAQARSGERQEYLRVQLKREESGGPSLVPYNSQSSGVSSSLSTADGLAIIPPFTPVTMGDPLQFIPMAELVD